MTQRVYPRPLITRAQASEAAGTADLARKRRVRGLHQVRTRFVPHLSALHTRLEAIAVERVREPQQIVEGYEVMVRRIEPLGMAYLWPASG